jgi:hypothetical protein
MNKATFKGKRSHWERERERRENWQTIDTWNRPENTLVTKIIKHEC